MFCEEVIEPRMNADKKLNFNEVHFLSAFIREIRGQKSFFSPPVWLEHNRGRFIGI
jgi:hypothetical protein